MCPMARRGQEDVVAVYYRFVQHCVCVSCVCAWRNVCWYQVSIFWVVVLLLPVAQVGQLLEFFESQLQYGPFC